LAAGATLAIGAWVDGPVRAADRTPTALVMTFHCRVDAGPKFAACKAKDPGDLDPRKIDNLRQAIEDTPVCLMPDLQPGAEMDRPIRFLDSPDLLKPRPPAPEAARHTIINPDWAQKPTAGLLQKVYPPAAKAAHVAGRVVLDCEVAENGAPSCAVAEESPADQGFGAAAIQASGEFRFLPKRVGCKPVGGAHIRVPLNFAL